METLDIGGLPSYVWTGLTSSFSGFLDAPHFVGVLMVVLLAAMAVVYRNAPAALAAAVLPFYAFVGLGRLQLGTSQATAQRYSYVAVAMVLPLIGWLLTRLVRIVYLRPLVMAALGLLVVLNLIVLHRQQEVRQSLLAFTNEQTQMDAAALLLHQGKTYPGQFPANSLCATIVNAQCVAQDVPDTSTLAAWVRKKQFPVPTHVAPGVLQAEESVLNVSVSSVPRYRQGGTALAPSQCATIRLYEPLTVKSSSPVSLFIHVAPSDALSHGDRDISGSRQSGTYIDAGASTNWKLMA